MSGRQGRANAASAAPQPSLSARQGRAVWACGSATQRASQSSGNSSDTELDPVGKSKW